jgi:hypothetical protein
MIQDLLDQERALIQPEPHRPLICLPARVGLHVHAHPTYYVACHTQDVSTATKNNRAINDGSSLTSPANIRNLQ